MECGRNFLAEHALPMGEKQQRIREEHGSHSKKPRGRAAGFGFGAGY
jgi:hypothetical protein